MRNPPRRRSAATPGSRKDLGASSRNSGLPQKPASSRFFSRTFPGEFLEVSSRNKFGRW